MSAAEGQKVAAMTVAILQSICSDEEQHEEDFKFVSDFYNEDFDPAQLDLQLRVMSSNIPSESSKDLTSIIGYLCELSHPQGA